jgi:hypothetical protein
MTKVIRIWPLFSIFQTFHTKSFWIRTENLVRLKKLGTPVECELANNVNHKKTKKNLRAGEPKSDIF